MDPEDSMSEETFPDRTSEDASLRKTRAEALGTMRTEVTILFSDIKGSTSYFERRGDAEGLAMLQHHNDLLFPVIEGSGGRVVKTIGDAIMACFKDPVGAIKAAIRMQQVMAEDRDLTESEDDDIHIRVALHMGPGLEKDNDVYGDVVNASAKVQQQTEPDQIVITDVLLEAARQAGAQCVKLGRAEMKGKDEAIDVYAVAWSHAAEEQLLEEVQRQYEAKLRDLRRQKDEMESELESSRDQWRAERRRLTTEIEGLEVEVETARDGATKGAAADLQAQIRYQLEEATRIKEQVERDAAAAQARWEGEKARFQSQIDSLQGAALQAMEQQHNPARLALAVREQVDLRLKEARKDWELQWDSERRRLMSEVEYLKKVGNTDDQKKRRAARFFRSWESFLQGPSSPPKIGSTTLMPSGRSSTRNVTSCVSRSSSSKDRCATIATRFGSKSFRNCAGNTNPSSKPTNTNANACGTISNRLRFSSRRSDSG